ncbi:MAG: hypothetical protein FWH48_06845 [Oscillospiraceae bacterium]|nr:hypothetical protein [Oscillospiraceae bacterium]
MRAFLLALFECSALMSALSLGYMLLNRLLSKRYAEKWRYYAWLIIIIGLIVPFRPHFGEGVIQVDVPEQMERPLLEHDSRMLIDPYYEYIYNQNQAENIDLPQINRNFANSPEAVDGDSAEPVEADPKEALEAPKNESTIATAFFDMLSFVSWWDVMAITWLVGAAAVVFYHIAKHKIFIKMVKRWTDDAADICAIELLENLKAELKIKKKIALQVCPFVASPMLVGFIRPRILLPEKDFTKEELWFVLKHELVHFKRKDVLYKFLLMIATAMHWFNPIIHLMAKSVNAGCEVSCDDEVVKGANIEMRKYYGTTILGVAKHQTKIKTLVSKRLDGGKNS